MLLPDAKLRTASADVHGVVAVGVDGIRVEEQTLAVGVEGDPVPPVPLGVAGGTLLAEVDGQTLAAFYGLAPALLPSFMQQHNKSLISCSIRNVLQLLPSNTLNTLSGRNQRIVGSFRKFEPISCVHTL